MATIKWLGGSANWTTASKWDSNSVPGATDDAVIDASGSYTVTIDVTGEAAPSVLATTITISGNSLLEYASGGITSISGSGNLVLNGTKSFVADASDVTHNSALTGLTSVAGVFTLQNGASAALAGSLTVTGTLNVDAFYGTFGSTLSIGGDLTNSGTLSIGISPNNGGNAGGSTVTIGGALSNSGTLIISDDNTTAPTVVTVATFNDSGTLALSGSRGGKATLDITAGAAPSVLATTITLAGNSLLEFASGGITAIAGSGKLVLNGTNSFVADASDTTHNSALRLEGPHVFVADSSNTGANGGLSGLTSNAGTLTLLDQAVAMTGSPSGAAGRWQPRLCST
jgi:hypothetical protein